MNVENILLKDILNNNTLYEVYEDDNGELQFVLDDNGEKIRICEIDELSWNENIHIFDYELGFIEKQAKYLGINEQKQSVLDIGEVPIYSAALDPIFYTTKDIDESKLINKSSNKIISFATNGDGSAGRNFIIHESDFFLNADRIAIQATGKMYYLYLYFSIMDIRKQYNYNRERKAIDKNLIKDVSIKIPQEKTYNNILYTSYEFQQSIAKNIEIKINKINKLVHFHNTSIKLVNDSISTYLDDIFSNKTNFILDDFIDEQSNKNNKNELDLVYAVTNSKGIIPESEKNRIIDSSADKSNYKIIEKYNFAFNPSRINIGSIGMLKRDDIGVVSPIYDVFTINKDKINPYYFEYYLKSNIFKDSVKQYFLNAVRPKLDFEDLKRFKISIVFDNNINNNKKLQETEIENIKKTIDDKKFKIKIHNSSLILLEKQKEEIIKLIFGENK